MSAKALRRSSRIKENVTQTISFKATKKESKSQHVPKGDATLKETKKNKKPRKTEEPSQEREKKNSGSSGSLLLKETTPNEGRKRGRPRKVVEPTPEPVMIDDRSAEESSSGRPQEKTSKAVKGKTPSVASKDKSVDRSTVRSGSPQTKTKKPVKGKTPSVAAKDKSVDKSSDNSAKLVPSNKTTRNGKTPPVSSVDKSADKSSDEHNSGSRLSKTRLELKGKTPQVVSENKSEDRSSDNSSLLSKIKLGFKNSIQRGRPRKIVEPRTEEKVRNEESEATSRITTKVSKETSRQPSTKTSDQTLDNLNSSKKPVYLQLTAQTKEKVPEKGQQEEDLDKDIYDFMSLSQTSDVSSTPVKSKTSKKKAASSRKASVQKSKPPKKVQGKKMWDGANLSKIRSIVKQIKPRKQIPNASIAEFISVAQTPAPHHPPVIFKESPRPPSSLESSFRSVTSRPVDFARINRPLFDKSMASTVASSTFSSLFAHPAPPAKVHKYAPSTISHALETSGNFTPMGASSPWRINDDETQLPRTRYYARSTDLLPSYSSDTILKSYEREALIKKQQRENLLAKLKESKDSLQQINQAKELERQKYLRTMEILRKLDNQSDISLNDSNTENISPENSVTAKNIPINRQANKHRSPLKALDIINTNSSLATHSITFKPSKPVATEKIVDNEIIEIEDSRDTVFGFDEDDDEEEEQQNDSVSVVTFNKSTLKDKLKSVKKLLPAKRVSNAKKPTRIDLEAVRNVFKSPMKSRNIRNIFESKLIAQTSTPYAAHKEQKSTQLNTTDMSFIQKPNTEKNEDMVVLFDDLEPDRTNDQHRRSYTRVPKKVKRKRNMYLVGLGLSDDEEIEDDEEEMQPVTTKKRKVTTRKKKANVEETAEFQKFVHEFNSMCEEVDKYKLVVAREPVKVV